MVAPTFWQSIGARLLLPIAALALLLAGLIGYIFIANYLDFNRQQVEQTSRNLDSARASFLDKLYQAGNIARMIAHLPELADALDARDQRVMVDAVRPFVEFTDLDLLTIYDHGGTVMARGDAPSRFGRPDSLAPWLASLIREQGEPVRFAVMMVNDHLSLIGAAPIATINHPIGGVAVAGFFIDEGFLAGLKARSNLDLSAEFEGRPIAWTRSPEGLERRAVALAQPLPQSAFTLSILVDDSPQRSQFRRRLAIVMTVLVISALLVIGGSVLVTLRSVTRPLDRITSAMIALAEGDRLVRVPCAERADEIGAMARAAEVFKRAMAETIELTQSRERERLAKERAEADALAQAEINRQTRTILLASPVALLLCRGVPPRIQMANPAALELFEAIDVELIGIPVFDLLLDPDDRNRLAQAFSAEGRINRLDARWRTRAGTPVWASISARAISGEGGAGVLLGLEEITQRKQAEADLRAAKEQAEDTLRRLQRTQESLVQAEKMASLSLLVAGVAHEINTPLGISLTAASLLSDKTAALSRSFESGQMRKAEFNAYLSAALDLAALMLSNMERAAELVHSFKQVAVDQTSAERRRFNLKRYIDEVLISLGPRLKRADHKIVVTCPPAIEMDSYPGALSQVLTNLVINAIIHAFEPGETGQIEIEIVLEGDDVELRFSDNGNGIPKDHLPRIFEPFFTTKRGAGGTGLGLHVVYNLAIQTLRGGISVASEEGAGTTFRLRIPRVA